MEFLPENSISPVEVPKPSQLLKKEGSNLFMGSCFAENLYQFYKDRSVDSLFSPFGNIYNPLSLSKSLQLLCSSESIEENEIFIQRELWRHFDFDSRLCTTDKAMFLSTINSTLEQARAYAKHASYLFLTLGTSFIYKNIKTADIVNNCHKLPGKDFIRENTSVTEMKDKLAAALKVVREMNPDIQIIISLSPVRHLRDSAVENSLSKARLRCLIDELSADIDFWYFPAYEILLDQLRDYRWYDKDLSHPSEIAVNFIMKRFIDASASENFKSYLKDVEHINAMMEHKIHHETEESQKFLEMRLRNFQNIIEKYPEMKNLKYRFDAQNSGNK